MSLTGFTTSNYISVPHSVSLDPSAWQGAGFTIFTVVNCVALAAWEVERLVNKGTGGGDGFRQYLYIPSSAGNTRLGTERKQATTNCEAESANGTVPNSGWVALISTAFGVDGSPKCYYASLDDGVVEVSSYATQTAGVGAPTSMTAVTEIGQTAGIGPHDGDIHFVGIWDRGMDLWEINNLYRHLRPTPGCRLFLEMSDGNIIGNVAGAGIVRDQSGYANHGTINGTLTFAANPPLAPQPAIHVVRKFLVPAAATGWGPLLGQHRNRLVLQ